MNASHSLVTLPAATTSSSPDSQENQLDLTAQSEKVVFTVLEQCRIGIVEVCL